MQQEAALADIGSPSNHQGVPQDIQDFARSSGYSVEQLTAQQEAVALAHSGEQLATPESISENLQLVGAVADTLNEACRAHVRTVLDALVATHSPSEWSQASALRLCGRMHATTQRDATSVLPSSMLDQIWMCSSYSAPLGSLIASSVVHAGKYSQQPLLPSTTFAAFRATIAITIASATSPPHGRCIPHALLSALPQ